MRNGRVGVTTKMWLGLQPICRFFFLLCVCFSPIMIWWKISNRITTTTKTTGALKKRGQLVKRVNYRKSFRNYRLLSFGLVRWENESFSNYYLFSILRSMSDQYVCCCYVFTTKQWLLNNNTRAEGEQIVIGWLL